MGWEGLGGSGTRPTELAIYSSQVATEALTAQGNATNPPNLQVEGHTLYDLPILALPSPTQAPSPNTNSYLLS
jgi:hypothetical protein